MTSQGMTIAEVAGKLGLSTRTVRRYIKAGKVEARLVSGPFGEEYRIFDLPSSLSSRPQPVDSTPGQTLVQTPVQTMDIIKEFQEKNLALAAQLGIATERIRNLESQVKLLEAARRQPWWKRMFSK